MGTWAAHRPRALIFERFPRPSPRQVSCPDVGPHDPTFPAEDSDRAGAVADRGRAQDGGHQRAADDAADVPAPGRLLHAQDGARGVHPHGGRSRGQELLIGRAGGAPPVPRAGVWSVRVPREPGAAGAMGDAVLRVEPRAVRARGPRRPSCGNRVFPVGRHLQPHGDRAVLGIRHGSLHEGTGQAALPADRRRQQSRGMGGLGQGRQHGRGDRSHAVVDRRRSRSGRVSPSSPSSSIASPHDPRRQPRRPSANNPWARKGGSS